MENGRDATALHVADLALPSVEISVAAARRAVTALCGPSGLSALSDTAALLTSEVVTNAVVHGRGTVQIRARALPDRLRVEVQDDGPGRPSPREAGPDDEGGRGMSLLVALADGWGVEDAACGKTVWFELSC